MPNALDDYRITAPAEITAMLQRLVAERSLVSLAGPQGQGLTTQLWEAEPDQQRLVFGGEAPSPRLDTLLTHGEVTAVAYLDKIKVQFDLDTLTAANSLHGPTLRASWPAVMYRFQRRQAFRVQPLGPQVPQVLFMHPQHPEQELTLRVLDVSLSGLALLLPDQVPMIPAGTRIQDCRLDLDDQTSLTIGLMVHHATAMPGAKSGVRLGCELLNPDRLDRSLSQYINQTQKRRAALSLDRR